uniref:Uncharacterized protein n=1 Tax=Pseudo-nitzschia australis TaxID=44445 RepID=A0A7S4ADB7_9STRA
MVSSWFTTQIRACWALTCSPTSLVSPILTTKESNTNTNQHSNSYQYSRTKDGDDRSNNNNNNKEWGENYGIGKVLSTLTSTTATSFSSWTESFLSNTSTMVARQPGSSHGSCSIPQKGRKSSRTASAAAAAIPTSRKQTFLGQQIIATTNACTGAIAATSASASAFVKKAAKKNKKNELLYPISPYDEIPIIRDLFDQLSPYSMSRSMSMSMSSSRDREQQEFRQERQDVPGRHKHRQGRNKKESRRNDRYAVHTTNTNGAGGQRQRRHQQRDGTKARAQTGSRTRTRTPAPASRNRNDAHEVPFVIQMPSTPTYSEDSELSLDECLGQYLHTEDEQRDQRSIKLTPHPSFEEDDVFDQPTALDVHHLYHASVRAEQELVWPSDEDNLSRKKNMITTKNRGSTKSATTKVRHRHRFRLV